MKRRKSVRGPMTGEELRDHRIRIANGLLAVYEGQRRVVRKYEQGRVIRDGVEMELTEAYLTCTYRLKKAADEMLARAEAHRVSS